MIREYNSFINSTMENLTKETNKHEKKIQTLKALALTINNAKEIYDYAGNIMIYYDETKNNPKSSVEYLTYWDKLYLLKRLISIMNIDNPIFEKLTLRQIKYLTIRIAEKLKNEIRQFIEESLREEKHEKELNFIVEFDSLAIRINFYVIKVPYANNDNMIIFIKNLTFIGETDNWVSCEELIEEDSSNFFKDISVKTFN